MIKPKKIRQAGNTMGTQNSGRKETTWNTWPKIENNIKMDLKEIEISSWFGIHIFLNSDQQRVLATMVMKSQFP